MELTFIFIIITYVGISIAAGVIASKRGRSGLGFFFLSILISPAITFAIILLSKDLVDEAREHARLDFLEKSKKQAEQAQASKKSNINSITEEIDKLSKLKESGALSEKEFLDLKSKLLNSF